MKKRVLYQIWVYFDNMKKIPFSTFFSFRDCEEYIFKHAEMLHAFKDYEIVKFVEDWKA